jgi:peptidoglycan/LPS O-acetylase OafA/YrhL
MFQDSMLQNVPWRHLLTWASFDYFGVGALFALAVHRGMSMESRGLRLVALAAVAGYGVIFGAHSLGWATWGLRSFQQTLLAVGLCGLIAGGSVGFSGVLKSVLEHPILQRIGQVSYGIYLFHNLAPLVAGKVFWFLWSDFFANGAGVALRTAAFAGVTWGLALASWRWIEQPLQGVRAKLAAR